MIDPLIKDAKRYLGLGAYHVLRCRAVAGHVRLGDLAPACLTFPGMEAPDVQGRKNEGAAPRLPPIHQINA